MQPIPKPITSRPGSTSVAYEPPEVSRVNSTIATIPNVIPRTTSGLGPVLSSTLVWTVVAVTTIIPVIGRKARPVVSGEKPRFCCMK